MTSTTIIDMVTAWVGRNICPKIKLKVPPENIDEPNDHGYDRLMENPVAFPMFVPGKDKLPPDVKSSFPSICVRLLDGEDDLAAVAGRVNIQLCFSTWNPGTHGEDFIVPTSDGASTWSGPAADADFQRNGDGWRDAWNLVDIARWEIESVTSIDGLVLDRGTPIKYGPLTEQEAIPDFYPFWFAWMTFSLTYPVIRHIWDCDNLL